MIQWLKRLWLIVIGRTPRPTEATVHAAGLVPPPIEEPSMTRAERRARESDRRRFYRRRRLRKDKWAVPQGPEPRKLERTASAALRPERVTVTADDSDDGMMIVDIHHTDKTKVLYEEDELYSRFCFRDTILDDLPVYFDYLARMRRADPQAWGFYREAGALLIPYMSVADIICDLHGRRELKQDANHLTPLSPLFVKDRPSFGCMAYGTSPQVEKCEAKKDNGLHIWVPKFMYYIKYDRRAVPSAFARAHGPGDTYAMTVYWDKRDGTRKTGAPQQFPIFIDDQGNMRVLRCNEVKMLGKRRRKRLHGKGLNVRGGFDAIPQHRWAIPHDMHEWAHRHKTTAQTFLCNLFAETCNAIEEGNTLARIDVEKDGAHAYFALDVERMPYFFKDRDRVLTASGLTKRIFHCVRPHKDRWGKYQPMQFRGLRQFPWAGYNVRITVPGLDHIDISRFDAGVLDGEYLDKHDIKRTVSHEQLGKEFRETMEKGVSA